MPENIDSKIHVTTWRGNKIDLMTGPDRGDVNIEDIAHSLSMQCRFTGHVNRFYCPTPDQKILTTDLRWIAAGDIKVGQKLIGFDEHPIEPGQAGNLRRKYRPSYVTHIEPVIRKIIRLEMEDGSTVKASSEHPWLVATKASKNQKWQTCDQIAQALSEGRNRYMHKFFTPWNERITKDAGWLSGIFDGEGYLSFMNRRGIMCGVAQNPGIIYDRIIQLLNEYKYLFSIQRTGNHKVMTANIIGGWRNIMHLLGEIRPIRLLPKFEENFIAGHIDKQMNGAGYPLRIVKAYDEGTSWVTGMETSTHTYFCEGYGAHNSIAEHSVYVSMHALASNAIYYLLHDAEEYLIGDWSTPVKKMLFSEKYKENREYQKIIKRLQQPILESFGLRYEVFLNLEKHIKAVDNHVFAHEANFLRGAHAIPVHNFPEGEPLHGSVFGLTSEQAEKLFLNRFYELMS